MLYVILGVVCFVAGLICGWVLFGEESDDNDI